jgi:hypothetical protein
MRLMRLLRGSVVAAASLGLFVPQMDYAANPGTASPSGTPGIREAAPVQDVALQPNGVLRGQVLDGQGRPVANGAVVVAQQGQLVTRTLTDEQGRFAVAGLRGGLYQVVTAQGGGVYRVWTAEAAPPVAKSAALIVNDETVVRGMQDGCQGGVLGFLGNPLVLAAIVAAAIAIPLALDDDDDAS